MRYVFCTWGVLVFKQSGFAFVLSLVVVVILAAVFPIPDQPETSFNEADTPVTQATLRAPIRITPPMEMPALLLPTANLADV